MTFDRRHFLKQAGAAMALGCAGSSLLDLVSPRVARAASPTSLPLGTPILVVLDLLGGNDALNTHVPHSVPGVTNQYQQARPSLGVKSVLSSPPYAAQGPGPGFLPAALDLDGSYGFHGSLVSLANRWHARGDVAVVQGVGESVVKERSHTEAAAYRNAGAFVGPNYFTGWLGRYNDLMRPDAPLASLSLAFASGYAALVGNTTAPVRIEDPSLFNWSAPPGIDDVQRFLGELQSGWDTSAVPASLGKALKAARSIGVTSLASAALHAANPVIPAGTQHGSLKWQLAEAAAMIKSGIASQTYYTTLPGFDTHGGQAYTHYVLLSQLDQALESFFSVIDASPRTKDVFVMITSEFGRQVTENAAGGTDHGRASSVILVGGGVRGGRYGIMPSFSNRDYDALIPTVDFRSVYASVLAHLGGNPAVAAAALGRDEADADFPLLDMFA